MTHPLVCDRGVWHAQVDLAEQGYLVLLPLTEHEPFDLVAYKNGRFLRVQVKFRSVIAGAIDVQFKSTWVDRNGTHISKMDKSQVDLVCVYCPDTRCCYYLDPRKHKNGVKLRVTPARNDQTRRVFPPERFTRVPRPLSSAG